MGSRSNAPKSHEHLARELAELPDSERRAVIAAAEDAAAAARRRPVASWRTIRAAVGIVQGLPADALEDTERLYDG